MNSLLYLAYGSNLHPLRLSERVPSARLVDVLALPDWELRFHKRGGDGSGKCDLIAGSAGAPAFGALFEIAAAEKPLLDRVEGLGQGYQERAFSHPQRSDSLTSYAYIAAPEHTDSELRPFRWYLDLVIAGARFHRLPEPYLARIEAVPSVPDPNPRRAALHQALLRRIADYASEPLR